MIANKGHVRTAVVDLDTGFYVTKEEAYLPEEWAELHYDCSVCGTEFVIYFEGDDPAPGRRPSSYCSDLCKKRAHNEQSRLAMERTRMRRNVG